VTDIKKKLENEELDLKAATKQISRFMDSVDLKIFSGRGLELTKLWMTLDVNSGLEIRYHQLGELLGLKHDSIRRFAKGLNWKELDKLIKVRNALGGKPDIIISKSESKVVKTREEEQIALTAEAATDEVIKQAENPAFSQLAANLRETTVLSLSLLKDSLIYAYKMSTFYVRQIELVVEGAGGMEKLTKDNALEIQEYEKKVNKYLEGVKYAINPNSIFNNLKMLGYSSDLLKANEDTRVMTPDHIQKMLLEMVQGEGMRNYTQKPFEAMIEETDYADVELPSIDGRANKNKESDARNKQ
jgi:hypothetical protein